MHPGGEPREIAEREVERHPTRRLEQRRAHGHLVRGVVGGAEGEVGAHVEEQHLELAVGVHGLGRPHIHAEAIGRRHVDGRVRELDADEVELRVADHVVAGDLLFGVLRRRELPEAVVEIYGDRGVGVAVHRGHDIVGSQRWRGRGYERLHGHARGADRQRPIGRLTAEARRDGGRAAAEYRHDAPLVYGRHARIRGGVVEVGRRRRQREVDARREVGHHAGVQLDGGPGVGGAAAVLPPEEQSAGRGHRAEVLEAQLVDPEGVGAAILGALGVVEHAALLREARRVGDGEVVLAPVGAQGEVVERDDVGALGEVVAEAHHVERGRDGGFRPEREHVVAGEVAAHVREEGPAGVTALGRLGLRHLEAHRRIAGVHDLVVDLEGRREGAPEGGVVEAAREAVDEHLGRGREARRLQAQLFYVAFAGTQREYAEQEGRSGSGEEASHERWIGAVYA